MSFQSMFFAVSGLLLSVPRLLPFGLRVSVLRGSWSVRPSAWSLRCGANLPIPGFLVLPGPVLRRTRIRNVVPFGYSFSSTRAAGASVYARTWRLRGPGIVRGAGEGRGLGDGEGPAY